MAIEARWNGAVIARSEKTVQVEGNHYFPRADVDASHLETSEHTSHCPWKGDARYYTVIANSERNENAAWFYPKPKQAAAQIADRIAFWKGVEVSEAE